MFVLATVVHGGIFSAMWTYLGVDTAARLEAATSLPPDPLLQSLLTLALVNGFIVSPAAMAYWVRSMREKSKKRRFKIGQSSL